MKNTKVYYHKTKESEAAIDYVCANFQPKGHVTGMGVKKTFATAALLGFVHWSLKNNPDKINDFLEYMNLERKDGKK